MKSRIFITEKFLGVHNWKDCDIGEVSFLKNNHHHNFGVRVECDVTHNDREIEFLIMRMKLRQFMTKFKVKDLEMLYFGSKSCEQIAMDIYFEMATRFGKGRNWVVSVDEDGCQGGIVNEQ